ncbi:outer membrane protein assembly factor BamB family protein [Dictyobacter arantiisoli]|uniref:AAA+ ATPase domain-containing protein n=1 Tax=Dictyobacter arantiisoli TaxID=2014874 RepID=A0A5A5T622_9CHLR|nr:PQQ-binding-like beta-propeller repeat protein [Dictyobacter arantiisoli]GCF06473.1 hypothetical protein KDI_00370 [Dictyobacter arantiisoli]
MLIKPPQSSTSSIRQLKDALWDGAAITSILWNHRTKDWVTNVQAADIDNDGDIEVLLSSRDGTVRVHTPLGAKKWDASSEGNYISALCAIPISGPPSPNKRSMQKQACVIVGTRNGLVYALDQDGERIPNWQYTTGRMVRQIYVHPNAPDYIVVGGQDRMVHVLSRATGQPLWRPYQTDGWVRSVFVCDIDGDQRYEILAGSGDKYLYLFDDHGQLLDKLNVGHQIYALFAAPLRTGGPMKVITSSNRSELFVWTIEKGSEGQWVAHKDWELTSASGMFEDRIHAIYVDDMNDDQEPEILLGAEDGWLYILNAKGELLWKRRFGTCIYSLLSSDINIDGQKEIIVGTEDSGVYAIQLELNSKVYTKITEEYQHALQDEQVDDNNSILKMLTPREKAILKDFIDERPPISHVQMALSKGIELMEEGHYEAALSLLLRVRQQRVQYNWSQPITTNGHIRTIDIGQLERPGKYDLVVGTDTGYIYAIDARQGADQYIWKKDVPDRIRFIGVANLRPGELDSVVALVGNRHVSVLNHQGEIVVERAFEQEAQKPRSLYINSFPTDQNKEAEILIGQENKSIAIWDANMEHIKKTIPTPQDSSILYVSRIIQPGAIDIISGSVTDHVYAYGHDGALLWSFQAQDRIQALCVDDIDGDGKAEVIVGSEDRYVYVLSNTGYLKWKYRMKRGVLNVTTAKMKLDSDDVELKTAVLVSSADSYLYALKASGDLLWKYKSRTRIKAVQAADVNEDGIVEIVVATENQLDLLQAPDRSYVFEIIQQCWEKWQKLQPDRHTAIMKFTHHPDEFIRAFSLAKLAGQHTRYEEDTKRFHDALRYEESLEVKKELVRAIVVFLLVPTYKEENARQARNFIRQLSADPEPEIRLAIVNLLTALIDLDEGLCFDYLEYFTHNVDLWVRRTVVRQINTLVEAYPERTFHLLQITMNDEEEWIQQETGRTLAHYFTVHPERVIHDSLLLLSARIKPAILEQISHSTDLPAIQHWFSSLMSLLTRFQKHTLASALDDFLAAIQDLQAFSPQYGDDYFQIYTEFRRILQIHSSNTLAQYQWTNTADDEEKDKAYSIIKTCMHIFDEFCEVANIIRGFERREAVRDLVTSLISATDKIELIRAQLRQEELRQEQAYTQGYYTLPEMAILSLLLDQFYQIVKVEINRLRGSARLVAEIRNKEIQPEKEVVVSLCVSNKGVSAADNIRVCLAEAEQDYKIVGARQQILTQLPTGGAASVEFQLQPYSPAPRLRFQITYDDAEMHAKKEEFADVFILKDRQHPYIEIANPYTSGTPIRDRHMFYGRREDIDTLREKLSSVTANKVVVLSGQRRMGKTSLVYQLKKELTYGPQVPVLIDLQGHDLQSMGHFLFGMAQRVREEMQSQRQMVVPMAERSDFLANPIDSFNFFLAQTIDSLQNEKIVFLLDEFEMLQEKINKGPLNENVLHYLRSLMQHRQGLNFLLVGAPRIRYVTEPLWSVFFNIAIHHNLKRLEQSEARALITEPVKGMLEYDMLALERMHKLSGNLPYFIHVLSEILISYCNRQHKSYVTINDINNVLEIVLEEQSGTINWIWNQPSSTTERFLLSVLAQDKGEDGRIFTFSDIYAECDVQGFHYEQQKIVAALQNLVREDLIEELHHGAQYRLPVGLFKEWLRKAKSPERVLQDECAYDD